MVAADVGATAAVIEAEALPPREGQLNDVAAATAATATPPVVRQ